MCRLVLDIAFRLRGRGYPAQGSKLQRIPGGGLVVSASLPHRRGAWPHCSAALARDQTPLLHRLRPCPSATLSLLSLVPRSIRCSVDSRASPSGSVAARPPASVARFCLALLASLLVLDFTRSLWQEGSPSHRPATWPRCFISFRPRSGARLHRLRLIWALLRFAIATPFTLPRFSLKPNWRILNSIFT